MQYERGGSSWERDAWPAEVEGLVNPDQLMIVVLSARLTPNQVDVFIDRAVLGRRLADIASEYGCSRSAISQSLELARRKMRRAFLVAA